MKSVLALCFVALVAALLGSEAAAFQPTTAFARTAVRSTTTTTSLNVFGTQKPKKTDDEKASKYWQGEWVCKDCGYIYNRNECGGLYFEQQGAGFRCPQCAGPRRRYAKKVGDVVGTTLDGGDAPILLFSFGGVIITIIFGFWAANNL